MDKVVRIYLAVIFRSMGMTLAAAVVGEQMTYARAFLGHFPTFDCKLANCACRDLLAFADGFCRGASDAELIRRRI